MVQYVYVRTMVQPEEENVIRCLTSAPLLTQAIRHNNFRTTWGFSTLRIFPVFIEHCSACLFLSSSICYYYSIVYLFSVFFFAQLVWFHVFRRYPVFEDVNVWISEERKTCCFKKKKKNSVLLVTAICVAISGKCRQAFQNRSCLTFTVSHGNNYLLKMDSNGLQWTWFNSLPITVVTFQHKVIV